LLGDIDSPSTAGADSPKASPLSRHDFTAIPEHGLVSDIFRASWTLRTTRRGLRAACSGNEKTAAKKVVPARGRKNSHMPLLSWIDPEIQSELFDARHHLLPKRADKPEAAQPDIGGEGSVSDDRS